MAVFLKDGALLVIGGTAIATDVACCCAPPTCDTLNFYVIVDGATFPDASPCTSPGACEVAFDNNGTSSWTFSWYEITGATYKLWRKLGGGSVSADCGDCVDISDYSLYDTYTSAESALLVNRATPVNSCNENNYRCWALEVLIDDERVIVCCLSTEGDYNTNLDCNAIEITASTSGCIDSGVGTFKSVTASFTASCPTGCDSICGDDVPQDWSISVDGSEVATGNGFSGSWSGEVSCTCLGSYPCSASTSVTVTWGSCSETVTVSS